MTIRLPVYDERGGAFARVRSERVLIYWPHGFGDFVHFGYVAPLLDPSNSYAIARFGDDFAHLYDTASGVTSLLSGVREIGDGRAQGARHLGIDWKRIRNRPADVTFPEPLASRVREMGITALLYTDYPEYEGKRAFPFHTKARALIECLVDPGRLRALDMRAPLRSALSFTVPAATRARIETRLRDVVEPGRRLYLIAPGGHTNAAKTWPCDDVATFERELPAFDSFGRSLTIDETVLRARFGDLEVPFAHLLTVLIGASHAFVGAAAGPLHAALAMQGSPVVGIWLAHHPDWYDEPNHAALHLTGPLVHARGYERRKATMTTPPELRAHTRAFPQRIPNARDVFEALESVR